MNLFARFWNWIKRMFMVNHLSGFGGKPQLAPFVAGVDGIAGGTSITVPIPTGLQANDIILVFFETNAGTTVSTPSGFTLIRENDDNTSAVTQINVYWKRATGSETSFVQTATDHQCALVLLIRGCIVTGTPYEGSTASKTTNSTSLTSNSPTTTGPDRLVINSISRGTDTATDQFSAPVNADIEGISIVDEVGTATGGGGGVAAIAGIKRAAGATSNTTLTAATAGYCATASFAMIPD